MDEISSILRDDQIINIIDENGEKHPIKFKKLTAMRALEIEDKFNELMIKVNKNTIKAPGNLSVGDKVEWTLKNDNKLSKQYLFALIDLCLTVIPNKNQEGFKLTRKFVLDNFDIAGVETFLKILLNTIKPEPEKKTDKK